MLSAPLNGEGLFPRYVDNATHMYSRVHEGLYGVKFAELYLSGTYPELGIENGLLLYSVSQYLTGTYRVTVSQNLLPVSMQLLPNVPLVSPPHAK